MLSRRYNRVIEVWKNTVESDGFSGNVTVESKLGNSWCSIKTLSANRQTELGLTEFNYVIEVGLRHRNDLNYFDKGLFFIYKGKKYTFNAITEQDLGGVEIKIIAVSNE